jgi:hypothetical protein
LIKWGFHKLEPSFELEERRLLVECPSSEDIDSMPDEPEETDRTNSISFLAALERRRFLKFKVQSCSARSFLPTFFVQLFTDETDLAGLLIIFDE